MNICCLLTGRGNNTLRDKNVLDVLGHPVLYYGANAAVKSGVFDKLFCSSDDDKILNEANKLGFEKIVRPIELALPTAQHVDCIFHALEHMKGIGYIPDIICVLLANNVTVTSKMIEDCVNKMKSNIEEISAVCPVYIDNDHHPLRCKRIENGEVVSYIDTDKTISTNRQDLPQCVFLAHNIWVINTKKLLAREFGEGPWSFLGKKVIPYIIEESIDIHDELDLLKASHWVSKNYYD